MTTSSTWRLSPSRFGAGRCGFLVALATLAMGALLVLACLPASAWASEEQTVEVSTPTAITVYEGEYLTVLARDVAGSGTTPGNTQVALGYTVYLRQRDSDYLKKIFNLDESGKIPVGTVPASEGSATFTVDLTINGSTSGNPSYYKAAKYTYNGTETSTIPVTVIVKHQKPVVTFDVANDSSEQAYKTTVEWGGTITKPDAVPTWDGHDFEYWYAVGDSSKEFGFGTTPIYSDLTLYAKWSTQSYTVTFVDGDSTYCTQEGITWNTCATQPQTPDKLGYSLVGWYLEGGQWDFATPVSSNMTLCAKWQYVGTSKVTFDLANGADCLVYEVTNGTTVQAPDTPERAGYEFAGWYTTYNKAWDPTVPITSDVEVTAKWVSAAPTSFEDVVEGSWYENYVNTAAAMGLMTGYKDGVGNYTGCFGPEDNLTRGQVATVLYRLANSPDTSGEVHFSSDDVVEGQYYFDAVNWCYENGIITGYQGGSKNGLFCPDDSVTRAQLATMIYRFAKYYGLVASDVPTTNFDACIDKDSVEEWACEGMTWCAAASILNGKDTPEGKRLDASQGATRAQAAKVFVETASILFGEREPWASSPADGADTQVEATFDDVGTFDAVDAAVEPAEQAGVAVEQPAADPVGAAADAEFDDVEFDQAA